MSTFDGFIKEFPDIQVDHFRSTNATASRRPLACFLSHVHSDHLVGLDTLRSPFVYCSAATRALVLRLERYPCWINFAKGILEARKRTYKDLKHLLKPLPLDTPTLIELSPGNSIRVTLLDANHCPGSVMLLFENDTNAALYTGDTRCEPWFVNALVRNPCLAEYTSGLRILDTIYLDTTFIEKDVAFQAKAEGLRELLQAVSRYPRDTIFHLRAWTFGYEDVWAALSKFLKSKVHVDRYKMDLYESLASKESQRRFASQFHLVPEAPSLVGFMCANAAHGGCLVADDDDYNGSNETVRIHSCDKGADYCATVRNSSVVWIRPVVCHLPDGLGDIAEVGAGGGGDDLQREAELELYTEEAIDRFCDLVDKSTISHPETKTELKSMVSTSLQNKGRIPISIGIDVDTLNMATNDKTTEVKNIVDALREMAALNSRRNQIQRGTETDALGGKLPNIITFPYSRHSSYPELCDLLDKLRPKDVWPCTVDPDRWFHSGELITIRDLFGQYCSGDVFRHDVEVASKFQKQVFTPEIQDSQATTDSELYSCLPPHEVDDITKSDPESLPSAASLGPAHVSKTTYPYFYYDCFPSDIEHSADDMHDAQDSQVSTISEFSRDKRHESHKAVLQNAVGSGDWTYIGLASTTDNHTELDIDLGYA